MRARPVKWRGGFDDRDLEFAAQAVLGHAYGVAGRCSPTTPTPGEAEAERIQRAWSAATGS